MGGFAQPQAHMQVMSNMIDFGMDPQEAIDAARFVVAPNGDGVGAGVTVAIEAGIPDSTVEDLRKRGHNV
eukprot:SAG31_NODE_7697_length_1614_cov_1.347855_1_plen_69_part_10